MRNTSSASFAHGLQAESVVSSSRTSRTPRPCSALVRIHGLEYRGGETRRYARLVFRSVLLMSRMTGFLLFRAFFATRRSSSPGYSVLSTTTKIDISCIGRFMRFGLGWWLQIHHRRFSTLRCQPTKIGGPRAYFTDYVITGGAGFTGYDCLLGTHQTIKKRALARVCLTDDCDGWKCCCHM